MSWIGAVGNLLIIVGGMGPMLAELVMKPREKLPPDLPVQPAATRREAAQPAAVEP